MSILRTWLQKLSQRAHNEQLLIGSAKDYGFQELHCDRATAAANQSLRLF
jgi:hypothetical protein